MAHSSSNSVQKWHLMVHFVRRHAWMLHCLCWSKWSNCKYALSVVILDEKWRFFSVEGTVAPLFTLLVTSGVIVSLAEKIYIFLLGIAPDDSLLLLYSGQSRHIISDYAQTWCSKTLSVWHCTRRCDTCSLFWTKQAISTAPKLMLNATSVRNLCTKNPVV